MYDPKKQGFQPRRLPWRDPRTFNHEQQFGAASLVEIPATGLGRKPYHIEDQGNTNFCTGYGSSTAGEYIEKIDMSPEWQVAKISEYVGYPIYNGAPVPAVLKVARLYGFLPRDKAPLSLDDGMDKIVDPKNWPKELDDIAREHQMGASFDIMHGSYDTFDNIRSALWQAKKDGEDRVALAFTQWFQNWGGDSVIRRGKGSFSWHCHLFIDWTIKNGEIVLIEQNSYGKQWGSDGLSYWSREAVNQLAENGSNEIVMFRDISSVTVKENQWSLLAVIYDLMVKSAGAGAASAWLNKFIMTFLDPKPVAPAPTPVPAPTPLPTQESLREKIYQEALLWIGKDASPQDVVNDEVGCVESVANIVRRVMPLPQMYGTAALLAYLNKSKQWQATLDPKPGNLIVAATGTGNGSIPGHCGIHAGNNLIMSNTSADGIWRQNYTIETWVRRYRQNGGMRVHYFEAIG